MKMIELTVVNGNGKESALLLDVETIHSIGTEYETYLNLKCHDNTFNSIKGTYAELKAKLEAAGVRIS